MFFKEGEEHIMKKVTFVVLIFSLCLIVHNAYSENEEKAHFQQAKFFYQNGNYLAAVLEYRKVLDLNPNNVSALNNIAVAYFNNGFMNDMIEELDEGDEDYLEGIPEYSKVLSSLSVISRERSRVKKECPPCVKGVDDVLEDSIFSLERAKELMPNLSQPYYNLGLIYLRDREYEDALKNLLTVKEKYKNDKWYLYYLSAAYSGANKKNDAIQTLTESVKKGFSDKTLLEINNDFDNIRDTEEFNNIISKLSETTF